MTAIYLEGENVLILAIHFSFLAFFPVTLRVEEMEGVALGEVMD